MAINKIVLDSGDGEQVLVDLTGDSVTPETLAEGATAHDASGERIVGTMKQSGGAVHWNDVEGKPVVMVGGSDTLTWDGNTEGLLAVEIPDVDTFYKVSDVALTKEDVYCEDGTGRPIAEMSAQGFMVYANEELAYMTEDVVKQLSGNPDEIEFPEPYDFPVVCYADFVFCVFEDNVKFGNFDFPEKGIYFNSRNGASWLKILNCTKFNAQEKIAPSHLYQPDWEQKDESAPDFVKNKPFGEMPTGGDTLTWDGNTEGLLSVEVPNIGTFVKLSNVALTWEEAYGNGEPVAALYDASGEECGGPVVRDELAYCTDDIVHQVNAGEGTFPDLYEYPVVCYADWVIAVFEDNVEIGAFAFPEKGVYFNANGYVRTFQLYGSTKFPRTKLMDKKYLPMDEITAAVLAALPIYNGEVEEV